MKHMIKKVGRPAGLTQRLVGGPTEPETAPKSNPMLKSPVISENSLRHLFGLAKQEEPKHKIPDSYRSLLNLGPQDIIDFFDVKIGEYVEFSQVDFVVPVSMLEHRIHRLEKLIKCSKQIIEGMASRIIKIRRGKNDPLLNDKAAREKYKRGENARIARLNAKLFRYRAALRSGNYHETSFQWNTKNVYFRDVVDDEKDFKTVLDTLVTSGAIIDQIRHEVVDLEAYRAVMSLGQPALDELGETESEQKERWQYMTQWENAVISAAVFHKIIIPRRDLAELLGLGAILDEAEYIEADTTQDSLAIKTKGACYGGRIRSEGFGRALSGFDKPLRSLGSLDSGGDYQDSGFGSLGNLSDDVESYDPR